MNYQINFFQYSKNFSMYKLLFEFILALGLCFFIYPNFIDSQEIISANFNITSKGVDLDVVIPPPTRKGCNPEMDFPDIEYPPCQSDEDCPRISECPLNSVTILIELFCLILDPHIPCDQFEVKNAIISCCEGKILPETKCIMCNLNIPPNGAPGVLIKCQNCTGPEKEIKVYAKFVSIPSYNKREDNLDCDCTLLNNKTSVHTENLQL